MRGIRPILEEFGCTVIGMEEAPRVDMEIEGGQLHLWGENATIKALTIHKVTGKSAISDDSGLCVDYLDAQGYSPPGTKGRTPLSRKDRRLAGGAEGRRPEERTARFTSAICFGRGFHSLISLRPAAKGPSAMSAVGRMASDTTPSSTWGGGALPNSPARKGTP